MPMEGDKKPCTFAGCSGTMTFSFNQRVPGFNAGIGGQDNAYLPESLREPGWLCDAENGENHFEPQIRVVRG